MLGSLAATSATLKSFRQSDPECPEVSFTRYWYDGLGLRQGAASWVMAKVEPGDDPAFGKCKVLSRRLGTNGLEGQSQAVLG